MLREPALAEYSICADTPYMELGVPRPPLGLQVQGDHESGRSDDSYWDKARRIILWWLGSFPSYSHQSTRIQAVLATIKATE